MIPYKLC